LSDTNTNDAATNNGDAGATGGAAPAGAQPTGNSDKGFPSDTPVAQMTDSQAAAYWKYHARKHEDKVRAYGDLTPEQVKQMHDRNQELENEKLTADQRTLKEATDKAAAEARAAAEAELRPKLLASQLKAVASASLQGEQLDAWLDGVDPAKFVGDNGEIDQEKVKANLAKAFGQGGQFGSGLPQHQNWGQHSGNPPAKSGADLGRAEATRRFGDKAKT
jgi:hypothetical protein